MTSASWMPRIRPHNNYALPLFFLTVKTNVDYQVVASFVLQDESADPIKEALQDYDGWRSQNPHSVQISGFLLMSAFLIPVWGGYFLLIN